MKRLNFESEDIIQALSSDYVIALPTETVFGFGIRWDSLKAYQNLIDLKRRPFSKPIAVMCSDKFDLDQYFVIDEGTRRLIKRFLPGPLTILVKAKDNCPYQTHLNTFVAGIRIPGDDKLLALLRKLPFPLQVTSANLSSHPPILDAIEIEKEFKNEEKLYGTIFAECGKSLPTTVCSTNGGKISIIREGTVTKELIEEVYYGRK